MTKLCQQTAVRSHERKAPRRQHRLFSILVEKTNAAKNQYANLLIIMADASASAICSSLSAASGYERYSISFGFNDFFVTVSTGAVVIFLT
jgi:hypothetical protein